MTPDSSSDLAAIASKLDVLIRLVALQAVAENQSLEQKAVLLSHAGLSSKEIADICGTTRNTVSVALSKAKRNPKSGRKKKVNSRR